MSGEDKWNSEKGVISAEEKTYSLSGLEEHIVWEELIEKFVTDYPEHIIQILAYGSTEMINNAIDHSEGTQVKVVVFTTKDAITILIRDNGIGIFGKIQKELNLDTPHDAIIELCKGKLTTDPKRHTGEGIFFTSRAVDTFIIRSGNLLFGRSSSSGEDWLLEDKENNEGTCIGMEIRKDCERTLEEVFNKFTAADEDFGFSRTHFPVKIAEFGPDGLISRSIAKRVVNRFSKFKEVILDFSGVNSVGQAFADEIFRVFARAHPEVHISVTNANDNIMKMIRRAQNSDIGKE